jgi:hypothetical protein
MGCAWCLSVADEPCAEFEGNHRFCHMCGFKKLLHKPNPALTVIDCGKPRFGRVSCSQCGGEFGPSDEGYSHCDQHGGRR